MKTVIQTLALGRPRPFLRDPHLWLAVMAALPVWAALVWLDTPQFPMQSALWPLLYLVTVVPLVEEVAFRGALQGWFHDTAWGQRRYMGLSLANVMVSVLFAAMHFPTHPPAWALAVVVPSLVLGHLRDRSGSIWPSVCMHGWYNAGYFGLMGVP